MYNRTIETQFVYFKDKFIAACEKIYNSRIKLIDIKSSSNLIHCFLICKIDHGSSYSREMSRNNRPSRCIKGFVWTDNSKRCNINKRELIKILFRMSNFDC
jgi:hypothetical protein